MIRLEDVTLARGDREVISGLTCSFPKTGVIAVLGPSGSGKTTLLRLFAGLLAPKSGSFTGTEGKRVSAVFQEDRLLPWLTALQNVACVDGSLDALECLTLMEIAEKAEKKPAELSGGMQRRVAIARALRYGGDMLVLDEPFKGLDAELKVRVASVLAKAFPLIVIAAHDEGEAALLGEYTAITLRATPQYR